MSANLIPNVFLRWHFDALASDPELVETLKQQLEIPTDVFATDGRLLTANQYAHILARTISLSDDEAFMTLERKLKRGSFHMMCFATINCHNLQQAINRAFDFYRLLSDQLDWKLEVEGDQCSLIFDVSRIKDQDASYFVAFISCIIWRWLSWLIEYPISLTEVNFSFDRPQFAEEIDRIFKHDVSYQSTDHRLSFDSSLLHKPVKQTPDSLKSFLVRVPESLLSHYQDEFSLSKRVREFIEDHDQLQTLQLQHVASHLHYSEQQLIRGLRAEGTRFLAIKDQVRKSRCKYLMVKSDLSNQAISQKLGFAEPAVFYRQFRKWFGETPNQYRANIDSK